MHHDSARASLIPAGTGPNQVVLQVLIIEGVTQRDDGQELADQLAAEAIAAGDPTGWFEQIYAEAAAGRTAVPWDRGVPSRYLTQWVQARAPHGAGRPMGLS